MELTEQDKKIVKAFCEKVMKERTEFTPEQNMHAKYYFEKSKHETLPTDRAEIETWARFYAYMLDKDQTGNEHGTDLAAIITSVWDVGYRDHTEIDIFVLLTVYGMADLCAEELIRLQEGEEEDETIDITAIMPSKVRTPIDKVTKLFFATEWGKYNGEANINVGKYSHPPAVHVIVEGFPADLSPLHKEVFMRVASRFAAGNMYVTSGQIARDIGMANSKANREAIDKCIDEMTTTKVTVDMTALAGHYKGFHAEDGDKLIVRGYLVAAEEVQEIKINHKETKRAWFVLRYPCLLEFGERVGQYVEMPYKAAQLPSNLRIDNTVLRVNDYIRTMLINHDTDCKIMIATLIDRCYGKKTVRKDRVYALVDRLMQHYLDTAIIKGYKKHEKDGYYTFTRVVQK